MGANGNGRLTEKQDKFCREYISNGGNATEAYRQAFNTEKMRPETVNRSAKELKDTPKIAARIEQLKAPALKKFNVTRERVIGELARIGFSDMRDLVNWDETQITIKDSQSLPDEAAACIAEISETLTLKGSTKKIKLHNKVAALVKLGEDLGMFKNASNDSTASLTVVLKQYNAPDGD